MSESFGRAFRRARSFALDRNGADILRALFFTLTSISTLGNLQSVMTAAISGVFS
jgi:hypothetical protein